MTPFYMHIAGAFLFVLGMIGVVKPDLIYRGPSPGGIIDALRSWKHGHWVLRLQALFNVLASLAMMFLV